MRLHALVLVALRDHLRRSIGSDAVLLYTTDTSEPGISIPAALAGAGTKDSWTYKTSVVNDDVEAWAAIVQRDCYKYVKSVDYKRVVAEKKNVAITLPVSGRLTDAAAGAPLSASNGQIVLTLYSGELRAFRAE